ncbi:MAG: leucine-rich repeat domain-containing protein [Prevotella sp.]|nr:leucine-rich repeat domain-containing protein [Prevotella sp.]
MMKRILLSFILAIGMTANIWADTVIEGIKYALNDDFTATVTGLDAPSFTGTITIPETIKFYGNTYQVAQIGERAFYQYKFKIVNLPNSLTSIGEWAFYGCTGLREINVDEGNTVYSSIDGVLFNKSQTELVQYPGGKQGAYTIPNSVENIKNGAFSGCTNLTSVTINSNAIMSKVYSSSFNMSTIFGNQVKTYIIGNFVTNIGANAFSGCTALTSVTIPNSVENIENGAFSGCTSLTSVTINNNEIMSKSYSSSSNLSTIFGDQVQTYIIGDSVTSIGGGAFVSCTSLIAINVDKNNTNYSSIDGVLFNKSQTELIRYPRRKQGVYTVPNSVENIKNGAFSHCTGRTSIDISNSVTSIEEDAFYNCTGLTSVTIGNSVTSIGHHAFYNCSGLDSLTIPSSVTSIGGWAFSGCTGLDSLTIPNSVTSIGGGAFQGCKGLTYIEIPNSVTSIEYRAFEKCTRLKDIYCHIGEPLNISDLVFYMVPTNTCALHVPLGCKEKYKVVNVWKNFQNIVEDLPAQSFTIGNLEYTKRGATVIVGKGGTLTGEVVIPESVEYEGKQYPVTSIGVVAFSGCIGLTSITIPNSVTSIGENAFRGCTSLTSVTINSNAIMSKNYSSSSNFSTIFGNQVKTYIIGDSVTSIGNGAFQGCTGLTSVTINSNAIMSKSYSNESNFSTIFGNQVQTYTIGNSVTSIGVYAFRNSTGLRAINVDGNNINYSSIDGVLFNKSQTELIRYPEGKQGAYTIPNSVASIEGNAFIGCTGLTSIDISNSVTSFGNGAFAFCTGLTSVTIPNSVTSIAEDLFNGCTGLTSIDIPNSVTSIGDYAFISCTGLTDIYCHIEEPLTIVPWVFSAVPTNTCTLHVPIGSKEKYEVADVWKEFLNIVEDLPTGIVSIDNSQSTIDNDVWFTLNGVRLNGKPTIPGIYIVNGLKVVIK